MQKTSELPDYPTLLTVTSMLWCNFLLLFIYLGCTTSHSILLGYILQLCGLGASDPLYMFSRISSVPIRDVAGSEVFTASADDKGEKPEQITWPQQFRREPTAWICCICFDILPVRPCWGPKIVWPGPESNLGYPVHSWRRQGVRIYYNRQCRDTLAGFLNTWDYFQLPI